MKKQKKEEGEYRKDGRIEEKKRRKLYLLEELKN